MSGQSRTGRMGLRQRTLLVEDLEDRTLLDGVVLAVLTPSTGLLQIAGDSGDNQFTLTISPNPGQIRIAGNLGTQTSINGEAFADFSLAAITDIQMILQDGKDRATATGFRIPGNLTVLYGNSADFVTLSNLSANNINILFSRPDSGGGGGGGGGGGSGTNGGLLPPPGGGGSGNTGGQSSLPLSNALALTGVQAATVTIIPGAGGEVVSLNTSTIGTARIITLSERMDRITVSGSTIGNLIVNAANDTLVVSTTQLAQATLTSARGTNAIVVSSNTFTSNATPPSLTVAIGDAGPNTHTVLLANLEFSTTAPSVAPNGFLTVSVGDAIAADDNRGQSMLTLSEITGLAAATVNVGRSFHSVLLDALTVAGTLNATVGAHAQQVELSRITAAVNVNLNLGHGVGEVTLNTVQVGQDLIVTNGDGNTTFRIGNGTIGRNMTLTTGNGNNAIHLDTVRVLNQLAVQAGAGTNLVTARNVICSFGVINGGSGPSNTYWDQFGNAGFLVIGFSIFIFGLP